ncbi:RNA exonuclease 3 [Rhizina undulata]
MFRPLSLWSKLPCPTIQTGRACSIPHCLFSHEQVVAPTPTPPSAPSMPAAVQPARQAEDPRTQPTPAPPLVKEEDVQVKANAVASDPRNASTGTTSTPMTTDPRLRNIVRANALGLSRASVASDDERGNKRRKLSEDYAEVSSRDSRGSSSDSSTGGVALFDDGGSHGLEGPERKNATSSVGKKEAVGPAIKGILKKNTRNTNMGNSTVSGSAVKRTFAKAASTAFPTAVSASTVSATVKNTPQAIAKPNIATPAVKKPDMPPPKVEKPMTLNPRLISRAPATHHVRLQLLTLLHQEYTRLHNNPTSEEKKQEILRKALDEEENVAKELRQIYAAAMKKRIFKLKKTTVEAFSAEQAEAARKKAAEEESAKRNSNKEGLVVKDDLDNDKPALVTGVTPAEELDILRELVHNKTILAKYGYILKPPNEEEVELARKGAESGRGWEACDRCGSRFQVFMGRRESDGKLAGGGKCVYHWGRGNWGERASYGPSTNEKSYSCCGQTVGANPGCTTAETHVYKVGEVKRLGAIWQYIDTPGPPPPSPPSTEEDVIPPIERAICLDCEMCYTTLGMELIRITATAFPSGEVVLDSLIMPKGEILDLNTRFSGVVSSQLAEAVPYTLSSYPPTPSAAEKIINPTSPSTSSQRLPIISSPTAARDVLLSLITPSTPLIGHALENDLNALRLCHPTVIDTAILFPHKKGLPARNKLKWLTEVHLLRRIQVEVGGEVRGHDSLVDARCAGELVRARVREVVERRRRRGVAVVGKKK